MLNTIQNCTDVGVCEVTVCLPYDHFYIWNVTVSSWNINRG